MTTRDQFCDEPDCSCRESIAPVVTAADYALPVDIRDAIERLRRYSNLEYWAKYGTDPESRERAARELGRVR